MNTTCTERKVARETRLHSPKTNKEPGILVSAETAAAGDRQIEEIERTFTLRYEW